MCSAPGPRRRTAALRRRRLRCQFAGLLADALGRPLTVAAETDLGLVGLARLGFAGIGEAIDHDPGRAGPVVEPDPVRDAAYAELRAELAGS